ncbi:MAG: hypothetical protein ACI9VS_003628, partial [Candidatus Binatia bacterium]
LDVEIIGNALMGDNVLLGHETGSSELKTRA